MGEPVGVTSLNGNAVSIALVDAVDDAGAPDRTAGVEPGDRAAAARSAAALTSPPADPFEDVRVDAGGRAGCDDDEDAEEGTGLDDGRGGEGAAGVKAVNFSRRAVLGSESNEGEVDADDDELEFDHECERCDSVSLLLVLLGEPDAELLLLLWLPPPPPPLDPFALGGRFGVGGWTKMKLLVLATGSVECERW
jgi:hypothetical protein